MKIKPYRDRVKIRRELEEKFGKFTYKRIVDGKIIERDLDGKIIEGKSA